jgi:YesN/AraC family two-component response regulator
MVCIRRPEPSRRHSRTADGFILKPFKAEDLQTKLSEIDNRRRARKQKLEQEPLFSRTKEAAVSA